MDGGATWKKLTNGLPAMLDRIGVSVSRSEPSVVYMVSETPNYQGELWRIDDAGATWRVVSKDPNINFRPFYYATSASTRTIRTASTRCPGSLYLSEDGGRTLPHDRARRARRPPGALDRSDRTRSAC